MSKKLSAKDKQAIFNKAKSIKSKLNNEAKRYKEAAKKQVGYSKKLYEQAAKLAKEQAGEYTQAAIRKRFNEEDLLSSLKVEEKAQTKFRKGTNLERVSNRILSSSSQARSRIYGATVSIWEDSEDRESAILEFFGKQNMFEIFELLQEQLGIDVFSNLNDSEKYQEIINQVQAYISRLENEAE